MIKMDEQTTFKPTAPATEEMHQARAVQLLRRIQRVATGKQQRLLEHLPYEKKKEVYQQQWHLYNLAQTKEKMMVIALLEELLFFFPITRQPFVKSKGRPKFSLRDGLFCLFMKLYVGRSSRRIIGDLELCKKAGYIDAVPHFNTLLNLLNDPQITPLLSNLITVSAIPLGNVESDFAADSTGFSTTCYGRWFNVRTGSHAMRKQFMKCHAMVGTATNIITAVTVTEGTANDSPQFEKLLEQTAQYFVIDRVTADKAYSSRANHQLAYQLGALPFIPFKSNARSTIKGVPIWRRMHRMYLEENNKFRKLYHLRSNVETTFDMMKAKLGFNLRSKTKPALVNEVLLKCLCHNLMCLVHEIFELNIDVDFNKCAEDWIAQEAS
jgi:transposase